jgi:putative CocE/NonD family hydrolase
LHKTALPIIIHREVIMDESDTRTEAIFGSYQTPPGRFQGYATQSFYLPMRDGVHLAVELHLPVGLGIKDKIPALLMQTRYWRASQLRLPFRWFLKPEQLNPSYQEFKPFFTGQGYALVEVDVRGTGASFGACPHPWHHETIQDSYEIVAWIVSQPWSNGKVGGVGISYLGTTAEMLPLCGHPAVKAIIPMFNHPDAYLDIAFPGGIFNDRFIRAWGLMDYKLDNNKIPIEFGLLAQFMVKGVKPVDRDPEKLPAAIMEHAENGNVYHTARAITCRDDIHPSLKVTTEDISAQSHWPELEKTGVAICGWGSWMDAGTADAVLRRFLNLDNACLGVIGAWEHGGQLNASPYRSSNKLPSDPPLKRQWMEIVRFFDACLKDIQNSPNNQKRLHYYTMGEEKWKTTATWPPEGTKSLRWFLSPGGQLSQTWIDGEQADQFPVDYKATTGAHNRWWELGGILMKSVRYPHRAEAHRHMLTYLSPPLDQDMEITGYPVVRLFVTSSDTDGAFFVYLEDVAESGKVTYLTEGIFRALHRKVLPSPADYCIQVPYHSFRKEDAQPLVPGKVAELHFGMLPTSVLVRRGHRLRLGIAGHDQGTFIRIPEQATPLVQVLYGGDHASYIEFPALWRGG